MSETPHCDAVRELTAEVALGIATAQERARVLGHVAGCASCRSELDALSAVADDLVLLVPPVEPPSGFEAGTAARLDAVAAERSAAAQGRGRRSRPQRVAALVAAAVIAAVAVGGVVHWSGRGERELAAGVRRTLATSNGQYFIAFPLVDAQQRRRGSLFAYEGDPPWVTVTLDEPLAPAGYQVELVGQDGATHVIADAADLSAGRVWGAQIPIAVHDAVLLRVVDESGQPVLSARTVRR